MDVGTMGQSDCWPSCMLVLAVFVVASCAFSRSFFHMIGIASVSGGEEGGIFGLGSLGICLPAVILSCDVVSSPDVTSSSSVRSCCRKSTNVVPISLQDSNPKLEEYTALSDKPTLSRRPVEKVQAHNAVIEYRLPAMPSNVYIRKKYSRLSYDLDSEHPIQLLVSKVFPKYALLKYHHRNCGPFLLCLVTFITATAMGIIVVYATLFTYLNQKASYTLPQWLNCSCLANSIMSSIPSISEPTILIAIYGIISFLSCTSSFYAVFLRGETIIYNYEPMRPSPDGVHLTIRDDERNLSIENYGTIRAEA